MFMRSNKNAAILLDRDGTIIEDVGHLRDPFLYKLHRSLISLGVLNGRYKEKRRCAWNDSVKTGN